MQMIINITVKTKQWFLVFIYHIYLLLLKKQIMLDNATRVIIFFQLLNNYQFIAVYYWGYLETLETYYVTVRKLIKTLFY